MTEAIHWGSTGNEEYGNRRFYKSKEYFPEFPVLEIRSNSIGSQVFGTSDRPSTVCRSSAQRKDAES